MGRLTADPDLKTSASGKAFCRFNLAVNRPYKQGDEQKADFFGVVCFNKTAEFVSKYFTKGNPILVSGSVQNNDYTDNNGVKHYGCQIVANSVCFCGSKSDNSQNNAGNFQSNTSNSQNNTGYSQNNYGQSYAQPPWNSQQFPEYPVPQPAADFSDFQGGLNDSDEIISGTGNCPF
jgi:single-strand DNA-binding protein